MLEGWPEIGLDSSTIAQRMELLPWGVTISVGRWSGMGGWLGEVYTE